MDSENINVQLRNKLDHRHLDLEYLVAKTKQESSSMEINVNAEIAEKAINYYEKNIDKELV